MSARDDEILQAHEREDRKRHEGVRQMLLAEGRADLVADLDKKMKEINNGVYGARLTWNALSKAQRHVLEFMGTEGCAIAREDGKTTYGSEGHRRFSICNICRAPTVRNLAERGLVTWDGGIFDPERRAVLTERGRFVLKHGRAQ